MADSSTSLKRKYEEHQSTPSPIEPQSSVRRSTGFSAPVTSTPSDSSSYQDVVVDDIQLAKQRAQEIAARLFSNAAAAAATSSIIEAKRPRFDTDFHSTDNYINKDVGQKPMISATVSQVPALYGYHQGPNKKIEIPNGRVGVIIGKAGDTIKYLQLQSGAKIQVTRDADSDPNSPNRIVELMGTPEAIAKAEQLINDVLSEAETGGSGTVSRRIPGPSVSGDQFAMRIPNNKVGLVIGKGGETIKNMQARTGARIQVIPLHLPPGDTSLERTVQIDGTSDQIESAKLLVNEVISENRARGGYSQQGYQAHPPTTYTQPGPPMQQFGYGAYPRPSPQYQQQQSYSGYPSQQTTQGSSGYDYYSQQSQGGPVSADSNTYNYNQQQPVSSYNQTGQQGYAQSGYNQPQPQAYDQQGYAYGNATNPTTQEGQGSYGTQGDTAKAPLPAQPSPTAQQSYNVGRQPSPNPTSYSSQPAYGAPGAYGTQQSGYGPGYGPTQAQKPPVSQSVYGQTPTAQGAYAQPSPVQPGYPPLQSGYAHSEAAPQRAAAQPGYAPQYNSTYGGGYYSQPPAYVTEASSGGTVQIGVPKESPSNK